MFELITLSVLSVFTLIVAFVYGKRIRDARRSYLEARTIVEDIVLSFNKQLRGYENRLENTAQRITMLSSRATQLHESLASRDGEISTLTERVNSLSGLKKNISEKMSTLEKSFGDVRSLRDNLAKKIARLEKPKIGREFDTKIESAIPIKREKALEPLTPTELAVLELLATEGQKTAPQIKKEIKLSREHTARLMKKLYEKGYLERTESRIPFKYHLKQEMQKFLKKPEQQI